MDNKNGCLIAVDAGGTKTEAVLFTPEGKLLHRLHVGGINPFVSSFDTACSDCLNLLGKLREEAPAPIIAAYAGIPAMQYFGGRIEKHLKEHAGIPIRAEADGFMLISAMLGHNDGAAIVCGTGSGVYIRNGENQYEVGGWGYILDGCGSGFVLGRRALRAVVRQADGRGEKTLLTELADAQIGGVTTDHLPEIYAGGRPCFASFAHIIFEARKAGDAVASRIFDDCVADLAEMVQTAHRITALKTLVLNGGIFRHFPEYAEAMCRMIPQEIECVMSDVPPLYGAVVEAMHDAGYTCDADFRQNFFEGYNAE